VLETGQQRALDAAGAALAAATLADAARTARPFAEELAGLERVLPPSPDLRALGRLAQSGAPTRAGLAAEFETLAAAPPSPPAIPAATPTSWPGCATPCPASSRSARSARPRARRPTPCWAAPRSC
jgi:hypothetical protein